MIALHKALAGYLATRRALGTKLREPGVTLGHFVDLLEAEGAEYVTAERAVRWATEPKGVQPATWTRRLGAVRQFAKWLCVTDPRTEVPPLSLLKAHHQRKPPYIFSDQEIEQLMAQASLLPSPTGLRALTHTTHIGLLASTGLRPGEALALDLQDVDLHSGILSVRWSKFGKSRFVPVHESVRTALTDYAVRRDDARPSRSTKAFLVSERGGRLAHNAARRTFAHLAQAIGIREVTEGRRIGRGPRLQDIRHAFTTKRLVEWYRAGCDVERLMPGLSTYLGHADVHSTYWYIQAIPELLHLAAERQAARHAGREG